MSWIYFGCQVRWTHHFPESVTVVTKASAYMQDAVGYFDIQIKTKGQAKTHLDVLSLHSADWARRRGRHGRSFNTVLFRLSIASGAMSYGVGTKKYRA